MGQGQVLDLGQFQSLWPLGLQEEGELVGMLAGDIISFIEKIGPRMMLTILGFVSFNHCRQVQGSEPMCVEPCM